jgi:hypothetical protein
MKKRFITKAFVESGMIDEETGVFPVFEKLIGTCKRWVSLQKDIGVSKAIKQHCRNQFPKLMKIQLDKQQITYADMKAVGIPLGEHINCVL